MGTKIVKNIIHFVVAAVILIPLTAAGFLYFGMRTAQAAEPAPLTYFVREGNGGPLTAALDSSEFIESVDYGEQVQVVFQLTHDDGFENIINDTRSRMHNDITHEESERLMERHRELSRQFFAERNTAFMRANGISLNSRSYQVSVCEFSPIVQLLFNDAETFELYNSRLEAMRNDAAVGAIEVHVPFEFQSANANMSWDPYRHDEFEVWRIRHWAGISNDNFTGRGINVGVLEPQVLLTLSVRHPELLWTNISGNAFFDWLPHAVCVVRTLAGSNGIAPNVNIVFDIATSQNLITVMTRLINAGCRVINLSMTFYGHHGQFTWISSYFDSIVRNQFISIVKATGNNPDARYVASSSMGYNIITVGAIHSTGGHAGFSQYGAPAALNTRKPTLVAPGNRLATAWRANPPPPFTPGLWSSGTSFATPIVTGIIARLMERFPILRTFPEHVKAGLIASALNSEGCFSMWSPRMGAGVVHYQRAASIFAGGQHQAFSVNRAGQTVQFRVPTGQAVQARAAKRAVIFWMANSRHPQVTPNTHTNFRVQVIDGTWIYDHNTFDFTNNTNFKFIATWPRSAMWTVNLTQRNRLDTGTTWGSIVWIQEGRR